MSAVQEMKKDAMEMLIKADDIGSWKEGCRALRNLSVNEDNQATVMGAANIIAKAMTKHVDDAEICENGCSALRNLVYDNEDNQVLLMKTGAADAIMKVMIKHVDNVEVCGLGCGALLNLALNDDNQVMLMQMGVANIIAKAMIKHIDDAEMCENGCCAFWNLAFENEDNQVSLMKMGAADVIMKAMIKHVDNIEVCRLGCGALWSLALNNDNQIMLMQMGAADIILQAMIKHIDTAEICKNGCCAFWNLACNADDNQMSLMKMGAADAIMKAMIKHADNVEVCGLGCGALWNLAANDDNQVMLMQMGAAYVIFQAMVKHDDDAEMCENGCHAFINLVCDNADNQVILMRMGVADIIMKAMIKHADNVEVCGNGCILFWNLMENQDHHAELMKMGVANVIMKAMIKHADDAEVCEAGCGVLDYLLLQKEFREELLRQGVVAVLENVLQNHREHKKIQKKGKRALKNAKNDSSSDSSSDSEMYSVESKNMMIQQFDLTEFLDECTKMGKENTKAKMIAVIFDLAVMNQQYGRLLKELKELIENIPMKELEMRMIAERQALEDVEKKMQEGGRYDLGGKRDEHQENLVDIAKKLKGEDDEVSIKKKQLFDIEFKMMNAVDSINEMRDEVSSDSTILISMDSSESNENDDTIVPELSQLKQQLSYSVHAHGWMNEMKCEVARIKKEAKTITKAVSRLGNKMNDLVKRMSPMIESVINETRSLIVECKEMIVENEQRFTKVNLMEIVADIEKQKELNEQRDKIRMYQDDLKNTKDEIRKEEIKMVEANHAQDQIDSTDAINDIRVKLNHLKTHCDEIIESITELCQDRADPSICRFPDLMPPRSSTSTDSSKNPHKIRVPKILKIKSRYYTLREQLGVGGFAQVFKVEYQKPGQEMEIEAFKKFPFVQLGDREISVLSDEIETLVALDHPNIIKLIGVSDDSDARDASGERIGIGMMMEYCENGSLRKYLDQTSHPNMDIVIRILVDVVEGMKYLHQHKPNAIIHRDLRSDNILLDKDMNAKICDFGIAKIIEATAGTAQYKAPESYDGVFEQCSNVYSFGCVIFEMLSGKRPWDGLSDLQIMMKIHVEKKPFDFSEIRQNVSGELVGLMERCLDYDKNKRPSFAQINIELNKLIPQVEMIDVDSESYIFDEFETLHFPSDEPLSQD